MIDIIKLEETFYEEEIRCGYRVSSKMKKLWAVELDLLYQFAHVCENHGLSYFLDGGTLLGAVRHKGFIPWDDDIDVIMPRKDYKKLLDIADSAFHFPYFLQTAHREDNLFRTHAQLRNSLTTGCIMADKDKKINKGIFIDIFILDGISDCHFQRGWQRICLMLCRNMMICECNVDSRKLNPFLKPVYYCVKIFFHIVPYKKFYAWYEECIMGCYSYKHTKMVADLAHGWLKRAQWNREYFQKYEYMEFEGFLFRVPYKYDSMLKILYGNYMKLPENLEAEKNNNFHGILIVEPDVPYKKFFGEEKL